MERQGSARTVNEPAGASDELEEIAFEWTKSSVNGKSIAVRQSVRPSFHSLSLPSLLEVVLFAFVFDHDDIFERHVRTRLVERRRRRRHRQAACPPSLRGLEGVYLELSSKD